ncbi:MAG TPA: hypothetical protein VF388_01365, partial [Lacunisphaera sp.]
LIGRLAEVAIGHEQDGFRGTGHKEFQLSVPCLPGKDRAAKSLTNGPVARPERTSPGFCPKLREF